MAIDLRAEPEYGRLVKVFSDFQEELARRNSVEKELVRPTNGATGALGALLSATRIDDANKDKPPTALLASLEYFDVFHMLSLCGFKITTTQNRGILYPTKEVIKELETQPSIFYLSIPNNPTGNLLPQKELEEILAHVGGTRVIIDCTLVHPEKYCSSGLQEKFGDKDIVLVNSFSKSLGLVRDRVGYFVSFQKATVDLIHPYVHAPHVRGMETVMGMLDEGQITAEIIRRNRESNEILQRSKTRTDVTYHPSISNFALLELSSISGEECRQRLEKEGYIVKSGSQLHIPDKYIRIDMGQPKTLPTFLKALDKVFE